VPLTTMLTPGSGSPVSDEVSVPVIVRICATPFAHPKSVRTSIRVEIPFIGVDLGSVLMMHARQQFHKTSKKKYDVPRFAGF
jgi:hypothetical protein